MAIKDQHTQTVAINHDWLVSPTAWTVDIRQVGPKVQTLTLPSAASKELQIYQTRLFQVFICPLPMSLCPLQPQASVLGDRKWRLMWSLLLWSIHLWMCCQSEAFLLATVVKSDHSPCVSTNQSVCSPLSTEQKLMLTGCFAFFQSVLIKLWDAAVCENPKIISFRKKTHTIWHQQSGHSQSCWDHISPTQCFI